jgi:hypothetical protein
MIERTTPIHVDAQEAKTFGEVWLTSLNITAPVNRPSFQVTAVIDATRTLAGGEKELKPDARQRINLAIKWSDLSKEELATVMAVVALVKSKAGI